MRKDKNQLAKRIRAVRTAVKHISNLGCIVLIDYAYG